MIMITRQKKIAITLTLMALSNACLFRSPEATEPMANSYRHLQIDCESSKELITAYTFLSDSKDINLKSAEATTIAAQVAKGCSGAAKRFIGTFLLLSKAKMAADSSIKVATEVAIGTDEAAAAFQQIFRLSFVHNGLDLDALTALKLAKSLSTEYAGNPTLAKDDFKEVVAYCLAPDGLAMPRPQCAIVAARVAKLGEKSTSGVGSDYVEMIKQLTEKTGANLAVADARQLTEALLGVSPHAAKNFNRLFRFATSEDGPNLTRQDAVNLAKSVASYTVSPAPSSAEQAPAPKPESIGGDEAPVSKTSPADAETAPKL